MFFKEVIFVWFCTLSLSVQSEGLASIEEEILSVLDATEKRQIGSGPCSDYPCGSNGMCYAGINGNSYYCKCNYGKSGSNCQNPLTATIMKPNHNTLEQEFTSNYAGVMLSGPRFELDGSAVRMLVRCNATGSSSPPTTVTWFADTGSSRQTLVDGSNEVSIATSASGRSQISILTINNIDASSSGVYTCRSSDYRSMTKTINVVDASVLQPANWDLRLSGNGNGISSGRLEVSKNGRWGTVCDDYWNDVDAGIACRSLKFTGGHAKWNARYGQGQGDILLDDIKCQGGEKAIWECPLKGWGIDNCYHYEDAGVECYGMKNEDPEVVRQWVDRVTGVSSEQNARPAAKVVGEPDAFPYSVYGQAWAQEVTDANQYITVRVLTPVYISGINVYETYNAGGIKSVDAKLEGDWVEIWKTPAAENIMAARIFDIVINPPILSKTDEVRLNVDCSVSGSFVEIDAIELLGKE